MTGSLAPGAVLLIACDPDTAGSPELVDLLGAERARALERALITRAAAWAADAAPGRVHVAVRSAADIAGLEALSVSGAHLFAAEGDTASQRLAAAAQRAWTAAAEDPLFIAWPALLRWRPEHAASALEDLADGCGVSVGPVFDGGFYLLALRRPAPSLFELPPEAWVSPDAMGLALTVIHEAGLEAGLLRGERGLRRAADVRAALADPLLDQELRAILQGG